MKYRITKRRYLDSLFILLIGTASIVALGCYIKPAVIKRTPEVKPTISVAATNRFVYTADVNQKDTVSVYHTDTMRTDTIYSTNSAIITNGSFLYNHLLYLHGNENIGMNIDTKRIFTSHGDYISPDGKQFLSIGNSDIYNGSLVFSLFNEHNQTSVIKTQNSIRQLDNVLGWSPDSTRFYYTVPYSITKQASMSATDQWLQKIGKDMKPMSRVRTWVQYSTSSAERIYQVNTLMKSVTSLFDSSNIGVIHRAFYNNRTDEFYVENDSGLFHMHPNDIHGTEVALDPKIATASSLLLFSTNSNAFIHSDGTGVYIADPDKKLDYTIFYATQSAKVTPLTFTGDNVVFSILDNAFLSGEMIDIKRLVRTEFFHTPVDTSSTTNSPYLLFIDWIKDVSVKF